MIPSSFNIAAIFMWNSALIAWMALSSSGHFPLISRSSVTATQIIELYGRVKQQRKQCRLDKHLSRHITINYINDNKIFLLATNLTFHSICKSLAISTIWIEFYMFANNLLKSEKYCTVLYELHGCGLLLDNI